MDVVFRVDSSLEIGTGHMVRCLTFANTLKGNGAGIIFLCRDHQGLNIKIIPYPKDISISTSVVIQQKKHISNY